MQQSVVLSNLETADSSCVSGHELDGLGLPVNVEAFVLAHVVEQLPDNSPAASLGKYEVLPSLELEQDIRLIMMDELDAMALEVSSSLAGFVLQLVTVVLIRKTVADTSHLLDPIFIEVSQQSALWSEVRSKD